MLYFSESYIKNDKENMLFVVFFFFFLLTNIENALENVYHSGQKQIGFCIINTLDFFCFVVVVFVIFSNFSKFMFLRVNYQT